MFVDFFINGTGKETISYKDDIQVQFDEERLLIVLFLLLMIEVLLVGKIEIFHKRDNVLQLDHTI